MKRKGIFITIIFAFLLITGRVYATDSRISEEELQESSNLESTEVSRATAVTLLSTEVTEINSYRLGKIKI